MIDLTLLAAAKLKETPLGALFVPVAEAGEHFLAGRINDYPVLVVIEGERPFHVAETDQWSRSSGLVIENVRFQVQVQSAVPVRSALDAPLGSLVLTRIGPMLLAEDDNGRKGVLLAGGKGPTGIEAGDVAFCDWRIVTGEGEGIVVHFARSDSLQPA